MKKGKYSKYGPWVVRQDTQAEELLDTIHHEINTFFGLADSADHVEGIMELLEGYSYYAIGGGEQDPLCADAMQDAVFRANRINLFIIRLYDAWKEYDQLAQYVQCGVT